MHSIAFRFALHSDDQRTATGRLQVRGVNVRLEKCWFALDGFFCIANRESCIAALGSVPPNALMQSARRRLHAANGMQAVTDFTDEELLAMPMPGEAARDANAHIVAAPAAAARGHRQGARRLPPSPLARPSSVGEVGRLPVCSLLCDADGRRRLFMP